MIIIHTIFGNKQYSSEKNPEVNLWFRIPQLVSGIFNPFLGMEFYSRQQRAPHADVLTI